MTRFFVIINLILLFTGLSMAQPVENQFSSDSLVKPNVILIPYDPLYYLSDADHDIAEQSMRAMKEVRSTFHEKSDYYVYAAISKYYSCIDLLHDTRSDVQEDLVTVFSTMGYRYEEPMHVNPDATKLRPGSPKKDSYSNPHTAYRYKAPEGNLKYMNGIPGKPGLLEALGSKYKAGYFVFLNQFEIKTNYNSCIDIANKVYQRTVMLHFSIYNRSGIQVAGNFAYAFFPSDSNEANDIMKNCFVVLGESISKSLQDAVNSDSSRK